MFQPMYDFFAERFPKDPADSDFLYRSTIMAKTCDTLRVLLPAGTRSNLGVYASGQAYEQMLLRMRAHPLAEVREYADLMLVELRKVIPAFLKRVDLPDRGVAWSRYLEDARERTLEVAAKLHGRRARAAAERHAHRLRPARRGERSSRPRCTRRPTCPTTSASPRARDERRASGRTCSAPTSASAGTAATSRDERSSGPGTGSTCSATTAPSATSSGTGR